MGVFYLIKMQKLILTPNFIIDGDTFIAEYNGAATKFRARWIDAPEIQKLGKISTETDLNQWKWGELSRRYLDHLIQGKQLTVIIHETDPYNRILSDWYLGRSNLQLQLLRVGLAVAFLEPRIVYESRNLTKLDIILATRILQHQYYAIQSQKGVWSDAQFMIPSEYRKMI
ncbi:Putative SNase-like nuclease (plasmid) [Planktothrix tepida]|uniref:Putative SNase-like nuclease n=2 Tax=Planktothrix TaxID=54304 RepID=A0A1J1LNE3_9CYAN|nr:Putative SNase-like nuclease [Planktothrix tepida]CUR33935.1 putative SNase-like nuclease [Planktothrix tepida PCC 9214]